MTQQPDQPLDHQAEQTRLLGDIAQSAATIKNIMIFFVIIWAVALLLILARSLG